MARSTDSLLLYPEDQVTTKPWPLKPGKDGRGPYYPAFLEERRQSGEVVAQLIVDTLGQVEPCSIEVVSATHSAFIPSAREFLATLPYSPGLKDGRKVRVLLRQTVTYRAQ
jgi:TonB family protein